MIVAQRGRLNNQLLPLGCQFLKLLLGHRERRQQQFSLLQRFKVTNGRVGHLDNVGLRTQHLFFIGVGPSLERWWSFSAVFDSHPCDKLGLLQPRNLWMLVPREEGCEVSRRQRRQILPLPLENIQSDILILFLALTQRLVLRQLLTESWHLILILFLL